MRQFLLFFALISIAYAVEIKREGVVLSTSSSRKVEAPQNATVALSASVDAVDRVRPKLDTLLENIKQSIRESMNSINQIEFVDENNKVIVVSEEVVKDMRKSLASVCQSLDL